MYFNKIVYFSAYLIKSKHNFIPNQEKRLTEEQFFRPETLRCLESSPENTDSAFEMTWQTRVVHLPDRSSAKPHVNLKPHVPDAIRLKNLPHMPN